MPGLDGLRALAVLAVIAYHLQAPWAPGGLLGVGVFFVLSGYLITDILGAQYEKVGAINLKQFWIRRARRLLPALWMMLLVVFTAVVFLDSTQVHAMGLDTLAAFFYISNWWYIFHHVSYFARFGPPSPLTHLWSLAVEEQFYLVWPLLLGVAFRFIRKQWLIVCLTLLGAAASAIAMATLYHPGMSPNRVYYGTDTRAFALLIGAALALLWPSRHFSPSLPSGKRWLLEIVGTVGLLTFAVMVVHSNQYQTYLYRWGMLMLAVATAGTVAALAHPATRLSRILGSKPLRWIGVRSYGIYLWHYPIIILGAGAFPKGMVLWQRDMIEVFASLSIAAVSWRYLEEPIRQGHWKTPWKNLRHQFGNASLIKGGMMATLLIGMITLDGLGASGVISPHTTTAAQPATTRFVSSITPSRHATKRPPTRTTKAAVPSHASGTAFIPKGNEVTAIGDSIMIDATPYLRQLLPGIVVSAHIGRQFIEAPQVISQLKNQGLLGKYVIIELGTNGPFTVGQMDSLIHSMGNRYIVFVNTRVPRPWQDTVNSTLAQAPKQFPNVTVVNWHQASAGKSSYFYPDHVHLNPTGAQYFARLLADAVIRLQKH